MPDLPADIRDRPITWTTYDPSIAAYIEQARAEREHILLAGNTLIPRAEPNDGSL